MPSVLITRTVVGEGLGPFSVYHTSIDDANLVVSNITRDQLLNGYEITDESLYPVYIIRSDDDNLCNSTYTVSNCAPPPTPTPTQTKPQPKRNRNKHNPNRIETKTN